MVMPISEILKQIDAEIARLKQVRSILASEPQFPKLQRRGRVPQHRASGSAEVNVEARLQRKSHRHRSSAGRPSQAGSSA
jgi:hypothetical protein